MMGLRFDKIKEIVCGAARIEEENGTLKLYRFTKEQDELYRVTSEAYHLRSLSAAGIKLSFQTDSKNLFLKVAVGKGSSRSYFSIDIFVNGEPLGYLDNFSHLDLPQNYTKQEVSLGSFAQNFLLGEGTKTVCIHLPWSSSISIEELSVDDGAFVEGIKPQKKLLVFGDSITQGYDALRPSNRYAAKLAEQLEAEEFNKAIGGERFFPALATLKDPIEPDYITVAYGTNDWSNLEGEVIRENCKAFYANLRKTYPKALIFALTPIWRKDLDKPRPFGPFEGLEDAIREAVQDLENVRVIPGLDLVPRDESYYADLRIHPNDQGFEHYFNNLWAALKNYL